MDGLESFARCLRCRINLGLRQSAFSLNHVVRVGVSIGKFKLSDLTYLGLIVNCYYICDEYTIGFINTNDICQFSKKPIRYLLEIFYILVNNQYSDVYKY